MNPALRELLEAALQKYGGRAVNATFEQVPGRGASHLAGMIDAPFAERLAYTEAAPWSNADTGRDILYEALGMNPSPTRSVMGSYQPPPIGGVPQPFEVNPAMVSRPQVPFIEGQALPEGESAMTAAETVRGLMDAQNAAAYHMPTRLRNVTESSPFSGIRVPMSGPMDEQGIRSLAQFADQRGLSGVSDTGAGVTMFPADQGPMDLQRMLSGGMGNDIDAALLAGGSQRSMRAAPYVAELSPSNYMSLFEQGLPEGQGQLVQKSLGNIDPQLLELLSGGAARDVYGAKASVDELFGSQYGAPRRDIQNMRKVASKFGLNALLEQARQGRYLPAVAAMGGYGALRRAGKTDTPES